MAQAQQRNRRTRKQPNFIDADGAHVWVCQDLLQSKYADIDWAKDWFAGRLDEKPTPRPGPCLLAARRTKETVSEQADPSNTSVPDQTKAHEEARKSGSPFSFPRKPVINEQQKSPFQASTPGIPLKSRSEARFPQAVKTSATTGQEAPSLFFTFGNRQPPASPPPKETTTQLRASFEGFKVRDNSAENSKLEILARQESLPSHIPQNEEGTSKQRWKSYGGLDMEGEFTKEGRFEYLGRKDG